MRTTILRVIGATLLASLTVQMAAAAEHPANRARATATEKFRNSNAYAAPDSIAFRSSGLSNEDEGAMSSGIAGR
jgi:hypothetical protein